MVGPHIQEEPSDLAAHGQFVRNLAWRLLHDEDAVEDVVQETMLAVVKAKPTPGRSLRPWLATVARNVIRRRFRGQGRRRKREEAAARPEAVPSAADMAIRAEMLREVVDAVLHLDEPNRSTVLLRYYEDLPPREIAARLGVGVETIRGRLQRAAAQLRRRLDARHPQGRAGWVPVLAGLCGLEIPAEILAGCGGGATSVGTAPAGTAPTAPGAVAGGLKGVAAAFLIGIGLGGLGVGVGIGTVPSPIMEGRDALGAEAPRDPAERYAHGDDVTATTLRGRSVAARRLQRAEERNRVLHNEVARLRREVRSHEPAPPDPRAFRFHLPENTPQFDQAKWGVLAGYMLGLSEILRNLREEVVTKGEPSGRTVTAAVKHNQPLAVFAIGIGAELGNAEPNSAYTHPSVIANFVRAALVLAGEPLSSEQVIALRTLGEAWEAEILHPVGDPAPAALALARKIAEVDGKLWFVESLKDVLTGIQRRVLFHPETEGRLQLDLLSPALVYAFRRPLAATDRADMEQKLLEALFAQVGAEVEDLSPYAWVARQWVDDVPGALEPIASASEDVAFPHVDHLQTQARAQVKAIERILGMGRLTREEAESLRKLTWVFQPFVPLETPDEPAPGAAEGD